MKMIAKAGSYKDGDIIFIPDGSIGITTVKTVMCGGLSITWLEPSNMTEEDCNATH